MEEKSNGTVLWDGHLLFADHVTADFRMNSEVHRTKLSGKDPRGRSFKEQMSNDPKLPVKATQNFLKPKKRKVLPRSSRSHDLNQQSSSRRRLKT